MTDFAKLVMGADTSSLKVALKDLADLATGAEKTDSKTAFLNKSLLALGAAGAVAATALAVGVKSAINTADSYAKLSQRLGIAVKDLGALAHAADLSGVSLDSVAMGVQFLSRNMANALEDATGATAQSFKTLNISVTDAQGNLRGTQDVLNDLADRFQAMPDGAQKTAFAMDLVGRGGAMLIPLLNGGSAAMEDMRKEAEALGLVMTEETAKAAEQFNDDLSRVASGLTGVFNIISAQVLPALVTLSEKMVIATKDGVQFFSENLGVLNEVLDRALVAATLVATFMAGKFAASLIAAGFAAAAPTLQMLALAASISASSLAASVASVAFKALGRALLLSGIGAVVIAAVELGALLIDLKRSTGSWGEAFALVGGVIKGVFADVATWVDQIVAGGIAAFVGLWEAAKAALTGGDISDAFMSAFKNIEFGATNTMAAIAALRAGLVETKDETVEAAKEIAVAVGAAGKSFDYVRVVTEDADVSAGTLNQTYFKTIKALKDQTGNVGKSGKAMAIWTAQANLGWRASDNMLESVGRLAGELYDLEEAESKGVAVRRAVMTDQQKLNEMIAEYAMFLSEGVINQDEFTRAVAKFKEGLTDLTDTRSIGEQMWDGLKSTFFDPLKKGSEEMADKFAAQVDRMSQAADRMNNGKNTVDKIQGGLDVLSNIPGPIGAYAGMVSKAISVVKSIVGIVKSVKTALFGGSFETTGGGLQLQLGAQGVTGQNFEDQTKKGGLFSGTKTRTNYSAVGGDQAAQFSAAYGAVLDNATTAFSLFGMDASREMMEQVRIAALNIKTSGEGALSESDAKAAVENWFKQLDAAIVGAVGGEAIQQLLDLATDGEAATETLIRLGNQLNTVNGLFDLIDVAFYDIGINGAVLADSLVKAVGGMDALQAGVNSFFANFYTQEEQFEKLSERLNGTFGALNMTLPTTRAGVRALVEGLDLTTEAGQAAFAAIINSSDALNAYFTTLEANAEKVVEAVAPVTGAVEDLTDAFNFFFENFFTQEEQFTKLSGDLNTIFAGLNMTLPATRIGVRDLVQGLDLTTEAGRTAYSAILNAGGALDSYYDTLEGRALDAANAAEDAAKAAADAANAARDAAEAAAQAAQKLVQEALKAAQDATNGALSALRKSIDAEKAIKKAAYNESLDLIKREADARTDAANLALDAARKNLANLQSEVGGIMSALSGATSQLDPMGSQSRAVSFLKAALQSGNLTGTGAAAQEASRLSAGNFANAAAFRREQVRTINLLSDISEVGTEQINYAELTVRGIEDEIKAIRESTAELIDFETLMFEQELEALDKQYVTAENQLNELRGIKTGIASVEAALKDFYSSIAAERNGGGAPPGIVADIVKPGREVMTVKIESTLEEIKKYSQATAVSTTKDFILNDRQWREAQAELVV
jgi:hypothetical protein